MAHDLTAPLQVHQALHGYAQGHQQLAVSTQLRPRDSRAMLVLSDISGPGVRPDEDGYLTGYALPESKYYVLARTWAAPEMPRPGCVWTHSLLIDFADLPTLTDLAALLTLFQRPTAGHFRGYDQPASMRGEAPAHDLSTTVLDFARKALLALYEKPRSRVVGARPPGSDADQAAMALWSQQWPRLRRAFRFCTLVGIDRSSELGPFDLQLYGSGDRGNRARFTDAADLGDFGNVLEDWVDDASSDLIAPDARGLRSFMRKMGGDIDSGREAFRPLCRLHVQLQRFTYDASAVGRAVEVLENDLGAVNAGTARALVIAEAAKLPHLDDTAFDFVLRHIDLTEPTILAEYGRGLGRQIWARDPQRLPAMLSGSTQAKMVAKAVLSELTNDDYFTALQKSPELASFALAQKPQLVADGRFWALRSVPADAAFAAASSDEALREQILAGLVDNDRDDLIPLALRTFGTPSLLRGLAARWSNIKRRNQSALTPLLKDAAKDLPAVAEFLSSGPVPRDLLLMLAHQLTPDAVPNDFGSDPWLIAAGERPDKKPSAAQLYLNAFLLARALGGRSRNQADLAEWSFDPLYHALSHDRLPEEAWRLLEAQLPWVFSWLTWDRCLRVRDAVIDMFVDRNLSATQFVRLTKDDNVFADLAKSAARNYRGRKFLVYVRYEVAQTNVAERKKLLSDLLDD